MVYDFKIAELLLRVESTFALDRWYELAPFRVEHDPERSADMTYELLLLPRDWTEDGRLIYEDERTAVYQAGQGLHRYYYWAVGNKRRSILLDQITGIGHLYFQERDLEQLLPRLRLSAFLSLESLLLLRDTFQLHASVIDWQGKGILFSAPSGTGKSTQAELWRIHEDALIINGDRGLLRLTDQGFWVYGSPYAGSSGIFTNRSAPIACIVTLSQGPENRLHRLGALEAFRSLYKESTVPLWDKASVARSTELLLRLVDSVPIYHLSCRPDREAVEVLKAELSKQHCNDP